jgi:hypothetical protein
MRYIFFAAANKHTQPARNAAPPKGVTAPSPGHPVNASAYRLPENTTVPATNNQLAALPTAEGRGR